MNVGIIVVLLIFLISIGCEIIDTLNIIGFFFVGTVVLPYGRKFVNKIRFFMICYLILNLVYLNLSPDLSGGTFTVLGMEIPIMAIVFLAIAFLIAFLQYRLLFLFGG